ncbi:hypothetical protein [Frankia sp. Cppng1_Ct_nod]|uniref:hypothetical protein n=1 Tax=Frankia sp. Cppng1_Ct_nod TaxID=2897162 RepID=UPI00104198AD|nr:hypothetical protein [Frankia sp. Cppng1_Ct_nod]
MGSGTASARMTARLVLVYVVLAGLFVMHGVMVGPGCPGGAGAVGSTMAVRGSANGDDISTMPQMAVLAPATDHAAASSAVAQKTAVVRGDVGGHGALCVSSPPRPGLVGLLALLLGVGVVGWAWPAWPWSASAGRAGHGCRAPPPAGSCLLVRLCVSRT